MKKSGSEPIFGLTEANLFAVYNICVSVFLLLMQEIIIIEKIIESCISSTRW
jgi:hypothetical protein